MLPSVIAIFCEDIREERTSQDTIVGTLPDNLAVPVPATGVLAGQSAMMPKLAVYVRFNLDVADKPKVLFVKLLNTDSSLVASSGWDQAVIDKGFNDAKINEMPFVGLILKMVFSPFPVPKGGRITAVASIDDTEYVAGILNIILNPIASPPPA